MTPKEKKWAIAAGVVAVLILGYRFTLPKSDNGGASADPTQPGNSIPGYVFNASKVANALYEAMRKTGTDEDAIISALNPISVAQFDQVIAKFGRQSYNKTMGNQINYFPLTPLPLEPLKVWLKEELSTERYNFLKMKFPQLQ